VHQLEEVDTFISDTDNTFIDGIDPHMMHIFKAILALGSWNSTGVRFTLFHEKCTTPILLLAPTFMDD
jgi:hypothetical protein